MLNINELETKWRRYKIKSYIPYVAITISTFIIIFILYFFLISKNNNELVALKIQEPNKQTIIKEKVPIAIIAKEHNNQNSINKTNVNQNYKQDKKNIVLSPSLSFMSNMKHSNIYNTEEDIVATQVINRVVKKVKSNEIIIEEVVETPEEDVVEEVKKAPTSSIVINRNSSQDDIAYVIKRFKKNNNPALSLFIAKKYYSLGEYHKSYNYALITNELNDNVEASWFIFAKSLVKLNQKDEAIKTLKRYIEHSHSNQAQILLNEIKAGEFQ